MDVVQRICPGFPYRIEVLTLTELGAAIQADIN